MEGSGGVFGTRFVCWVVVVSVFLANSARDYERVRLVDVCGHFVFGSAICEAYVNVNVRGPLVMGRLDDAAVDVRSVGVDAGAASVADVSALSQLERKCDASQKRCPRALQPLLRLLKQGASV